MRSFTSFCAGGAADISRWWDHREQWPITLPAPEGRQMKAWSVAPPGLGRMLNAIPVVPPPANIRRPSGTKERLLTCEKNNYV